MSDATERVAKYTISQSGARTLTDLRTFMAGVREEVEARWRRQVRPLPNGADVTVEFDPQTGLGALSVLPTEGFRAQVGLTRDELASVRDDIDALLAEPDSPPASGGPR